MIKKIFGVQTNIEWFDVKTKFKQILRKITYSWLFQELICLLFMSYMKFVYHTSKVTFINQERLFEAAKNKAPLLIVFWHNRLMMIPFITLKPKKLHKGYNFMTLASRHGDGRFVGKTMEKFGLISILGSSQDKRKSSRGIARGIARGIDIGSFKKIFEGLKKGYSLGITPDGPRGPNQKINGEIVNIARISKAGILATSYSSSRFKKLNTWDKFTIPLPFSNICFYFDEKPIYVAKNSTEEEVEKIKTLVEERINFAQDYSFKICNETNSRKN